MTELDLQGHFYQTDHVFLEWMNVLSNEDIHGKVGAGTHVVMQWAYPNHVGYRYSGKRGFYFEWSGPSNVVSTVTQNEAHSGWSEVSVPFTWSEAWARLHSRAFFLRGGRWTYGQFSTMMVAYAFEFERDMSDLFDYTFDWSPWASVCTTGVWL